MTSHHGANPHDSVQLSSTSEITGETDFLVDWCLCDEERVCGSRARSLSRSSRRCSDCMVHRIVISSSRDGKAMLVRYPVNSSWPRDPSVPRLKTSILSSHLSDTNRNATNVASLSGRARMGLLDRIFRRDLILRFVDLGLEALDRSGEVARCHRF
jgi:hypothetical protein